MASSTLGNIFNVSDSEAEARPNSEIETEKQSSQGYKNMQAQLQQPRRFSHNSSSSSSRSNRDYYHDQEEEEECLSRSSIKSSGSNNHEIISSYDDDEDCNKPRLHRTSSAGSFANLIDVATELDESKEHGDSKSSFMNSLKTPSDKEKGGPINDEDEVLMPPTETGSDVNLELEDTCPVSNATQPYDQDQGNASSKSNADNKKPSSLRSFAHKNVNFDPKASVTRASVSEHYKTKQTSIESTEDHAEPSTEDRQTVSFHLDEVVTDHTTHGTESTFDVEAQQLRLSRTLDNASSTSDHKEPKRRRPSTTETSSISSWILGNASPSPDHKDKDKDKEPKRLRRIRMRYKHKIQPFWKLIFAQIICVVYILTLTFSKPPVGIRDPVSNSKTTFCFNEICIIIWQW